MKATFAVAAAGMVAAQICVAATPEERGAYLVQGPMGCGNCHTPMGPEGPMAGMDLAGTLILDQDGIKAYSANITPGGRVALWSDAELAKAIRELWRKGGYLYAIRASKVLFIAEGENNDQPVGAAQKTLIEIVEDQLASSPDLLALFREAKDMKE